MPFFKRAGISRFDFEMMSLTSIGYSALNKRDGIGDLPVVCDYFLHAATSHNLGIVLVFGSAEAGKENLRRSLAEFVRMRGDHLILQEYEGEAPLDPGEADEQLAEARRLLSEGGYLEYAPLRFAKAGCEDRYTQLRQQGCDLLAVGLGAVSRLEGAETVNTTDLVRYIEYSSDFSLITEDARALEGRAFP